MLSQTLETLREILFTAKPRRAHWRSVCDLIDGCEDDTALETVVQYAASHLERWPDALRMAPTPWRNWMFEGREDPRLGLVRRVNLQGKTIDGAALGALAAHPAMAGVLALIIQDCSVDSAQLQALFRAPRLGALRRLVLSRVGVNAETAQLILSRGVLPALEHLELSWIYSEPGLAGALGGVVAPKRLRSLRLASMPFGDGNLEAMARSPILDGLESLSLSSCRFYDVGVLLASKRLSSLRSLDLSHNRFVLPSMMALSQSTSIAGLTTLRLDGCGFGSAGLTALARSTSLGRLEALGLAEVGAKVGGVAHLATSGVMVGLRELDLYCNPMGAEGVEALNAPQTAGLRRLRLGACELGDGGIDALIASVARPELSELELSNNGLTATGVEQLAWWPGLARVASLGLWGNEIGDEGVEALVRSPFVGGLRTLDLAGNGIGRRGAEALAASESLAGLRALNVSGNPIDDIGMSALCESSYLSGPVRAGLAAQRITGD